MQFYSESFMFHRIKAISIIYICLGLFINPAQAQITIDTASAGTVTYTLQVLKSAASIQVSGPPIIGIVNQTGGNTWAWVTLYDQGTIIVSGAINATGT